MNQSETNQSILTLFECEIPGRVFIKKNTQRVVGYGNSKHVIYSPKYLAWENSALVYILQAKQKYKLPIDFKCVAHFEFYFKNAQAEPDLSNCIEGPQDLLQKAGVITNDKLIISLSAHKVIGVEPKTVIIIVKP